jgi:hypothetical protein
MHAVITWSFISDSGNKLIVYLGFHTRKYSSAVWARAGKTVGQASPRPKKFKEYRFERAPNY